MKTIIINVAAKCKTYFNKAGFLGMITKLDFMKNGNFELTGTIDIRIVDFNPVNLNAGSFFSLLVKLLMGVKKCIARQLADDNKILYDERLEVVKSIDEFLTAVFALALIDSPEEYHYNAKYKGLIEINLEATKMKYIKGSGRITENLPPINNYESWIDDNLMEILKKIIVEYDVKGNKNTVTEGIARIIFYSLYLRYRIEYIR